MLSWSLDSFKMYILGRKERVKVSGVIPTQRCLASQGQDRLGPAPVWLLPLGHSGYVNPPPSIPKAWKRNCILPAVTKPDNWSPHLPSGSGSRYVKWYPEGSQRQVTWQLWGSGQLLLLLLTSLSPVSWLKGERAACSMLLFSWDTAFRYPGQRAHLAPLRCLVEVQPS